MPRIRNFKNLTSFRANSHLVYRHIDELFGERTAGRERPQRDRLGAHRTALARPDAGHDPHQRGPPVLGPR
ncbi:hypothetical protein AB0K41_27165 [Actinomadura coerulea]